MEKESFRWWLDDYLRRNRISQAELARRTGFSTGTISRWITGERLPNHDSADRLADALGLSRDLIFDKAGIRPVEDDDSDLVRTLIARVRAIDWSIPERVDLITTVLDTYLKTDRAKRDVQRSSG